MDDKCSKCLGDGYIGFKTPARYSRSKVVFCDCPKGKQQEEYWDNKLEEQRLSAQQAAYLAAKIPPAYIDYQIEDWAGDRREAVVCARELAQTGVVTALGGRKTWLYMHGEFGVGKTTLCVAVLKARIDAGQTGLFTKAGRLVDDVRESYNPTSGISKSTVLAKYVSPDVLFIDELGKQYQSGTFTDDYIGILTHVIGERYDELKTTIISTNVPLPRLREMLKTPELTDRIWQRSAVCEMVGRNYRHEEGVE